MEINIAVSSDLSKFEKKINKLKRTLIDVNKQMEVLKDSKINVELVSSTREKYFWEFWR